MKSIILSFFFFLLFLFGNAQLIDTIYLWSNEVPGETKLKTAAVFSEDTSRNVSRLAEVSNPILVAYYPESNKTNASIIICPGGGYQILAIDLEGYEIAQWVNKMGITAYVLQYRVPNKKEGALQDIQRAIRLVRQINDQQKIGVMGFSAGASLSARASTLSHKESYKAIDNADQLSCQPDFTALIYPAYLDEGENRSLTPELQISKNTPPMFIFGTADDKYGNSALVMTTALRDNKRPVELHYLAEGGHGYGMRKGNVAAETWPPLLKNWLNFQILK